MSAIQVAEAKRQFSEASARHQAALEKVRGVQNRIEWAQAKQSEITAKRLAGTATEADASEYAALAGDIEVLRAMLTEAQAAARAADPTEAAHQLATAEQLAEKEAVQAEFDALAEQAAKLDAALCDCIRLLHERGRQLGYTAALSQSWRASDRLARAFRFGVCP